jgi:Rrf2 family iron-sulfur cluster assembly transcriptional regulator
MLSGTSQHALRALSRLAENQHGHVLGRELAREARVPPQYLSKIMLMLRNAGLVDTARGVKGGYRLLRPAQQIRLREIVEIFEGPLDRPNCLLGVRPDCSDANPCPAHPSWKKLREAYTQFLEGTTIGDFLAGPDDMKGGVL